MYSVKEEFCRLGKELYSAEEKFGRVGKESRRVKKEFGLARKKSCRLGKEFESAKLLCNSAGKQFGQGELLFCRVQLLSGRAKFLGKRVGLVPCLCELGVELLGFHKNSWLQKGLLKKHLSSTFIFQRIQEVYKEKLGLIIPKKTSKEGKMLKAVFSYRFEQVAL
ncbi:hypothetical protein [Candidatus Electronema sp. PJ]|uniref:hypothetical protein n=1 Tax=Candidatus Electronema sp. PJ TaxID=3401572 RepID=UPI003AA9B8FD